MRLTLFAPTLALLAACGSDAPAAAPQQRPGEATAIVAGGCFWCTESDFDKLPGVLRTVSGYAGGKIARPTYEQVSAGGTGHIESVQITYDPRRVSYGQLVAYLLRHADVVDGGGQFCDRGAQYRSAVFFSNAAEKQAAQAEFRKAQAQLKQPIATLLLANSGFWPAEGYHQDYYRKNPVRYKFYRWNCGRDQRLAKLWQR